MITSDQLQNVLREIAQLSGVNVTIPYPHVAPTTAKLEGAINIHGTPLFWEVEMDLRELKRPEDVSRLIASLLASFDKAEKRGAPL